VAFNNIGSFFLAPGQSATLGVHFGQIPGEPEDGGFDHGAQWIMADPIGIDPARLMVTAQIKEHRPRRGHPGPEPLVLYWATIKNIGSEDAHFSLQGGGNV
jgi:hypothetical protein